MATIDIVKDVLVENLDLEADKIAEDATLESLGVDSLDMVELICDLEEKCEVEFGEPEGIETIGQLVAHIDSLK
ncbi:acyl carrier protein [Gordonibacter massiliensis (ex Traore et al. 2017)]|uniref:acyl carrier protein n=1 Tax=Gordonibacter massiliensis (ex Traore et al. 2017) TaxID=1841863 RepID=UPI001C8C31A4|nr:phosphopantetheine-binding protein [Gordonibacter massiliensis (ex Traore et al. 2017)]MBX9033690.1 acyl carrier protein [Gordonibacter massiliensis (ex Traore et al. 2017)]